MTGLALVAALRAAVVHLTGANTSVALEFSDDVQILGAALCATVGARRSDGEAGWDSAWSGYGATECDALLALAASFVASVTGGENLSATAAAATAATTARAAAVRAVTHAAMELDTVVVTTRERAAAVGLNAARGRAKTEEA